MDNITRNRLLLDYKSMLDGMMICYEEILSIKVHISTFPNSTLSDALNKELKSMQALLKSYSEKASNLQEELLSL